MENNFGFCANEQIAQKNYELIANDLLGIEQFDKIQTRYNDMRRNFNNVAEDYIRDDRKAWTFSEGLCPFTPKNRTKPYSETTAVPVPMTHPDFTDLTTRTEKRGAIGLDLPTWFNIRDGHPVIMLVTQDPLRSAEWYGDKVSDNYLCTDAVVSSPFGLHDAEHRGNGNGGKRMWLLVKELIGKGYGVYLTDCRKYFVYSHKESDRYTTDKKTTLYKAILHKEIDLVEPQKIVALGADARSYCGSIGIETFPERSLPHFSGAAGKQIKAHFDYEGSRSIAELAKMYADEILGL